MNILILLASQQTWFVITVALLGLMILAMIFNFFSVLLEFLSARGCFAASLLLLAFLPAIFFLCLAAGFTWSSVIILVLAVAGAVAGYIMRDSEGNVGKFGYFLMVVSMLIILITLFSGIISDLYRQVFAR